MDQVEIEMLLSCAGSLHLAQIPAMALFFRQILGMGPDLARLSPANQRIVFVMAVAVVMLTLGIGVVVMIGASELARGALHARALAALMASFWCLRLGVQVIWYAPVWPRTPAGRVSHIGLSLLFCAKTALYATALAGMFLA